MHWEGGEQTAIRIGGEDMKFYEVPSHRKHDPLKHFCFAQPLLPQSDSAATWAKCWLVNEPTILSPILQFLFEKNLRE